MSSFLEIAVNVPQVAGTFHYHLPPELEGRVEAGHLVEVPFGRQTVQGVVLRPVAEPQVAETRPVLALHSPHYDTIAGYMLGKLERIPHAGDTVESDGVRLRVEAMDGMRIDRISLTRLSKDDGTRNTE